MNDTLARSPTILAVDRTKLEQSKEAGAMIAAKLLSVPCSTPEQEQNFTDFMNRAHVIVQDLEAERELLVRPLIDDKSTIDGLYRDARKPWENVKALCKTKIGEAQTRRRQEQEAARQLAAQAASVGDTLACTVALAAVPEASKPDGAGVSWEWIPMIQNANDVPREFLEISQSKVMQYAKAYAKSETIPAIAGLRFERRAKVGVR